ncbi:hypothetical protein MELA_02277 [Candidatus Methylomirabilis lanthanidiphila]|uniref:Uncharacterized protein n=1 Tax=Candidatus Methylomirabilis lanthanidiphila TaxID=2211376 RepID=A0A564ZKN1_9BACT|nr:hypothetical protein [Candidatus Methylomirabilis lanthanidiphila]VUZ85890.1 hypothetical protein MELA_02277 [Candidatus Methylomirabilis lanthanidiphila]
MWAIIENGFDLVSAFVDFLIASSVSVPALQFAGIILVAFLLGLLLGRITKRGVQQAVENAHEREANRISLDFERLTPLGPSKEETAEHSAMDISNLRVDQARQKPAKSDQEADEEPTLLK